MGHRCVHTDEEIVVAYRNLRSMHQVAMRLHVSRRTVQTRLLAAGFKPSLISKAGPRNGTLYGKPARSQRFHKNNELVDCACGCGQKRWRYDYKGIERKYICGHSPRGKPNWRRLKVSNKRIESLYHTHKSSIKVAAILGCTPSCVRGRLKEAGVPRIYIHPKGLPSSRKLHLPEQKVLSVYRSLKSLRKTADEFGCSVPVVRAILHKHGVKPDGMNVFDEKRLKAMARRARKLVAEDRIPIGRSGKDSPQWKGGKVRRHCAICGKFVWRQRSSKVKRPTCSKVCDDVRSAQDNTGPKHYAWNGASAERVCMNCGKTFQKYRHGKKLYFCSYPCAADYMRGEHAPRWEGGKSFEPYPTDWTDALRESIRIRDGHKCRLCGKTQKENGRLLSIHHIDFDKENLDPENLVSTCISCHGKMKKGSPKQWQRYLRQVVSGRKIG